jgi:hypothetical protein
MGAISASTARRLHWIGSLVVMLLATAAWGQAAKPQRSPKPEPSFADVKYGPHERNVLDFWKAPTKAPAPVLVFIHGGGFVAGSKDDVNPAAISQCLKWGISFAIISYRYSNQATLDDYNKPEIRKLTADSAAINHYGKDSPPIFMVYGDPDVPLPADARPGQGIHHPIFGHKLKEKADELGLECIMHQTGDNKSPPAFQAILEFLRDKLVAPAK